MGIKRIRGSGEVIIRKKNRVVRGGGPERGREGEGDDKEDGSMGWMEGDIEMERGVGL